MSDARPSSTLDVVFVMDASKSMDRTDPGKIRVEAVKMFIDMCSFSGSKVGMVVYSDGILRDTELIKIDSMEDKHYLKKWVNKMPKGQGTNISSGLKKAVEVLNEGGNPNHRPVIILLSDGKDNFKDTKSVEVAKASGHTIYTIGLDWDGSVDKKQLEQLAKAAGGKSYITKTPDKLPDIFSNIFSQLIGSKITSYPRITGSKSWKDTKIHIPEAGIVEANPTFDLSISQPA